MHKLSGLTEFYEYIYEKYNNRVYISSDPIELVYKIEGNKEFIALVSSLFSYGKVENIKNFLIKFFNNFGGDPFNIREPSNMNNLYYRFQKFNDIKILIELIVYIYKNYGSLENIFINFSNVLEEAFTKFTKFAKEFGKTKGAGNGYFSLFPVGEGLYSKRLNMFLRWMIRKDNIDLGLWHNYRASELKYPMDTHIIRFALSRNIIRSKQNNVRNVNMITDYFKKFSYDDPVKYDFALTRQGLFYKCTFKKELNCNYCADYKDCLFY